MLSKLTIKNVALIENAEIEFSNGLNVLSGETGAGKSVILDSVNFVLGAKADKSMIRYGQEECMVKAEFILPQDGKAVEALRELDIDSDGEIIISRKYSLAGKNSIKINGSTVTASMLRTVTDHLVDVHGQSEHFFLLKESNQLKMLDDVAGAQLKDKKQKLAVLLEEKKQILQQISLLGGDEKERSRRLDVLKFQMEEINAVDLKDGEEEELNAKRNKMNNLERLISALQEAKESISGENGALDCIRYAKRAIGTIARLGEEYDALDNRLESLSLDAEDLADSIADLGDELYFDENEAEELENRLDAIKDLKKKYGGDKKEIDEYLQKISAEYDLLSDCEGQYAALTEKLQKTDDKIYSVCLDMTALRKQRGLEFCKRVTQQLKTLNIASAQFDIQFHEYTKADVDRATSNGLDSVCFLFSANAGEPMKALGKIISGGEMSRFMLAVKTQLSDVNELCTYIFDEIDAGISGKTAKVVGEKFADIAKHTQIIAVSHLAQIAVMSDSEYLIEKKEENGKTYTVIRALENEQQVEEIVRLLGGETKDKFAFKHATELLRQAKEYKSAL